MLIKKGIRKDYVGIQLDKKFLGTGLIVKCKFYNEDFYRYYDHDTMVSEMILGGLLKGTSWKVHGRYTRGKISNNIIGMFERMGNLSAKYNERVYIKC